MCSFVIYEKDKSLKELYVKVIKNFLSVSLDHYEIYEFDRLSKKVMDEIDHIGGIKIFLLNIDSSIKEVCRYAKSLREKGDIRSQIILLSEFEWSYSVEKLNNILFLDYIKIDEDVVSKLLYSIKDAYRIVTKHDVYSFTAYDEIHRLSYDDICYIEKNTNDDSVTIYTSDDSYVDYKTIIGLEKLLEKDARFYKTHRSCIVNVFNIASYDIKGNTIIFKNGMTTNLVSKYKKARLFSLLRATDHSEINDKC